MTTPSFPALPEVTKSSFKSQRAATIAVNKAEALYEQANRNFGCDALHGPQTPETVRLAAQCGSYLHEAWGHLVTTCRNVEAAGFRAKSRWVEYHRRQAYHSGRTPEF